MLQAFFAKIWRLNNTYWDFIVWETLVNYENLPHADSLAEYSQNEINWSIQYGINTPRYLFFYAGWYTCLAPFILIGKILDWLTYQPTADWLNPNHYGVFSWIALFFGALPGWLGGAFLVCCWLTIAYSTVAIMTMSCILLTIAAIPLRIISAPFEFCYQIAVAIRNWLSPATSLSLSAMALHPVQITNHEKLDTPRSDIPGIPWHVDIVTWEELQDPVILPCAHTIDRSTVAKMTKKVCPLDRTAFNPQHLKRNFTLFAALTERNEMQQKQIANSAIAQVTDFKIK